MSRIGQVSHKLTVVEEIDEWRVKVLCECGNLAVKPWSSIKYKSVKSCGCLRKELLAARNTAKAIPVAVGDIYGRLTITSFFTKEGYRYATVNCSCGTLNKEVQLTSLFKGATASCGCLRSELVATKNRTHGKSATPLYRVWRSMLDRCYREKCPAYPSYGGRGITVSESWRGSYEAFKADMGEPPFIGATIDRKDNDGSYCKENCRWATRSEQSANTRRNKWFTYKGRSMMLKDIAALTGINLGTLYYRVNSMHLSIEEAVNLTRGKHDE